MKRIYPVMLAALMLCSCGQTAGNTAESTTSGSTAPDIQVSETDTSAETEHTEDQPMTFSAADEKYVKLLGRTAENDGVLWLGQTDSGCEFSFTGTSASVTVLGDDTANTNGDGNYARFAVYLNGERVLDELVREKEKTYEIFSSDEDKENTVSIIKLSEASNSAFGIRDITVDSDNDPVPTEGKALKIEFIGDSITCGYGVDDEVKEHHFSTATEDGTKTYAYKAAQALDADYSMVCNSGHGIISGYTTQGKKVAAQQMPKFYTKTARSYTKSGDFSLNDVMWDFER
ncbi:MAG: GDSL family lipase, partial [Oscillospiraceae bacterium]|nr:GDSL family lipase [Oscillospiraceae bacterium]